MKIYDYKGQKNICGTRIREARTRQRMSQSDLAARLQVQGVILERDCISKAENNARIITDYEARAFAKALGVSLNWLMDDEQG